MSPECQEKNARGLEIVTIGINKAADEILILDDSTREKLASGKLHDQRRGTFGVPAPAPPTGSGTAVRPARPTRKPVKARPEPRQRAAAPKPWTSKQEKLALIYNEQGMRPAEIAQKLGVSSYLVTQIILAAKNRGKL
jgi:hypothetical protein